MLSVYNLQDNTDLEVIKYSSEEEWLQLRQEGIGGSDAAAVMGLSKYKSPLQCYKEKLGLAQEDLSDNVFIRKGKDLEALIRDQYVVPYMYEKGYYVRHPEFMFVNKKCPWLRANLDGIAVPIDTTGKDFSDNIVIEIKWVSEYAESNWYGDDYFGIPVNYYAQVQHYMTVVGASKTVVGALFDKDWTMHYFEIPYDVRFSLDLLQKTHHFYKHNLKSEIPPRITPSLDKQDELEKVEGAPTQYNPSEEMSEKCANYTILLAQRNALDKQLDGLHDEIFAMYYEGNVPSTGFKVSSSKRSTTRVDQKKLEKDFPDAYEACKTTSEWVAHTIKKK